MSMSRWSVASAIVAVAAPVVAAPVGNFNVERLSKVDKTLASDAFQGRGTASAIEPTVINYIAGELKAAGVQPGGDLIDGKRSWFQKVPLLKSEIVGAPDISLDENGAKVPLQQGPQIAVLPPLNGAKQVDIHEAPLVFVGYGVDAPERGWNDFKGEDMHGKILVELVNDPDFEAAPGEPVAGKFGGKAMTYYGRWTYKFEEAARHGAAGVILIHETVRPLIPGKSSRSPTPFLNSTSSATIPRRSIRSSKAGFSASSQRNCSSAQASTSTKQSRGPPSGLPAYPAQGDPVRPLFGEPADHHQPQCRRNPAGKVTSRRDDHLFRLTGTISASESPTRPATGSIMARSTMRPASA